MRRMTCLFVCSLLVLPVLSRADVPVLDPRTLGLAEAVLDYCTKAVPNSAAKQKERVEQMSQGVSPGVLAQLRRTREYRQAFEAEADFAAKVDQRNARSFCSRLPAVKPAASTN
jgi:hypothetical protein